MQTLQNTWSLLHFIALRATFKQMLQINSSGTGITNKFTGYPPVVVAAVIFAMLRGGISTKVQLLIGVSESQRIKTMYNSLAFISFLFRLSPVAFCLLPFFLSFFCLLPFVFKFTWQDP